MKVGFASGQAFLDFDSPGAAILARSRVGYAQQSLPDFAAVACRLHEILWRRHDLKEEKLNEINRFWIRKVRKIC